MKYNVKLIMKDGNEILLGIPILTTHSTNISIGHVIKEQKALLLVLYNKKIQTFIDVTGVPDHLLLIFNRDKEYIGFNVCKAHGDSSYLIGTRAKYALVIPDQDFPYDLHAISHLETEYDVNIEMD